MQTAIRSTSGQSARALATALAAAALTALATPALAQEIGLHGDHPHLHINPRWKECSFQLSANLTKESWRQFATEASVVTYFRPLTDAAPMGKGKFEISVTQWETGIDDSDPAWNDTFVHPDSAHILFEGSRLAFPGLIGRVGVGERTDVGVYFTKSPGANYGFYGGQVQQNVVRDYRGFSAAVRGSFVSMYGPEDLDFTVLGVDVVASRRFAMPSLGASVAPYVVLSSSGARAHERSSVVTLSDAYVSTNLATLGATLEFSAARVAMEYTNSTVPSLSMKIGFAR
jgi:hypothetical protein